MSTLAQSRGFSLLGDLFLHGLTPTARSAWVQVPEAAGHVHALSEEAGAEAFTRALHLDLAPFESAFCSEDGLVGGVDDVRALRVRCGLDPAGEGVDHLGTELRWMGFLPGAAADAERDSVPVGPVLDLEREVLDHHLLRWLPGLTASLRAQADAPPLWVWAAGMALDLAVNRRVSLGGVAAGWALPDAVPVLEDPRAGLRRIAEHLALPSQAGGVLCRSTLVQIGRRLDLPAGFGTRADLLEGLLRSAAHYGRVPQLCEVLDAEVVAWDGVWAGLDGAGLAALSEPWHGRIAATRSLLGRLGEKR